MENKYLQVRKESIFTKFVNFIKGLFGYKVAEVKENPIQTTNNVPEKTEKKASFLEELRIEKEEDPELIKLQNQFENKELDLCVMSNEQVESLNSLYKRQVSDLKKKLDDKKTQLAIMKNRIKSYSANM